jgi:hypothetical protein
LRDASQIGLACRLPSSFTAALSLKGTGRRAVARGAEPVAYARFDRAPEEAHEIIELSLDVRAGGPFSGELQKTRSKATVVKEERAKP